jgi:hypothetical protein
MMYGYTMDYPGTALYSLGKLTTTKGVLMDIAVYLPDDLGQRAKQADLPFSRLLRAAVTAELDRIDTLAAARDGMIQQHVETMDFDSQVILRFTGKQLASGGDTTLWLIDDGRVLIEDADSYATFDDTESFAEWVRDWQARKNLGDDREAALREALEALGETVARVIDL